MTPCKRAAEAPWPFNKHIRKRRPIKERLTCRYDQYRMARTRWMRGSNVNSSGSMKISNEAWEELMRMQGFQTSFTSGSDSSYESTICNHRRLQ